MSPAEVVKAILEQEASVTFTIKVNHLPDDPTDLIVINDRGNLVDGKTMPQGRVYEHPKLQFIFRSLSYSTVYSQAKIVSDLLDSLWLRNHYDDTTHYVVKSAQRLGTIFSLGIDGKTRRSLVGLDYILDFKRETL